MKGARTATGLLLVSLVALGACPAPPSPTKPPPVAKPPPPSPAPPPAAADAGPPKRPLPRRIELRVGVHLAAAFASGTRIDQHLEALDSVLIGRLDLYAHARPGSGLTLWENEDEELVAAAIPLDDGSRFLTARFTRGDGHTDWYDARGFSLRTAIETRPVPLSYVTSAFGERHHPLSGVPTMHEGVDYGAPEGTPVRAVAGGIVNSFTISPTAGVAVELLHDDDYLSRYFHLQTVAGGVMDGAKVEAGQVIGFVGATGLATGPHLHFELLRDGVPLDAAGLLPASPTTRLQRQELATHQATLRELVDAQLANPTVSPNWRPPPTLRAPPPETAWEATAEEPALSAEEERAVELAEIEAERRADARAHAELEARLLAEAEREAERMAAVLEEDRARLREEHEREERERREAEADARAEAEARRSRTP